MGFFTKRVNNKEFVEELKMLIARLNAGENFKREIKEVKIQQVTVIIINSKHIMSGRIDQYSANMKMKHPLIRYITNENNTIEFQIEDSDGTHCDFTFDKRVNEGPGRGSNGYYYRQEINAHCFVDLDLR